MIIYKCKMCGGNLNIQEGEKTAVCEYCQTQQTVPSTSDEKRVNLFNRANHYRQICEFDKALVIYEHILEEDGNDAEVYWSIVLCRYGIEYVEDPVTKERKPTINRVQAQSILQDVDYQMALEHADYTQKNLYEKEATEIDGIQKEILRIAKKEEPYDIFISYKEKASNGERTKSSVLAQDVYNHLTKEGYRVFFSRISLEDKLGQKYEPYIYSALNSSKVMLVIGTERDEFTAPWVKNEWSRFLTMMRENAEKLLVPCFRDITIDELPDEFQILQSQDMGRIGFEQDLLRGIEKVVCQKKEKNVVSTPIVYENNQSLDRLLQNGETYMKLGNYKEAIEVYNKITKLYPEDHRGWWGMMMSNSNNFIVRVDEPNFEAKMNEWFSYFRQLASSEDYEKGKQQYEKYKRRISQLRTGKEIEEVENIILEHQSRVDSLRRKQEALDQEMTRENVKNNQILEDTAATIKENESNRDNATEKMKRENKTCNVQIIFFTVCALIGAFTLSEYPAERELGIGMVTVGIIFLIGFIQKNKDIVKIKKDIEECNKIISEQEYIRNIQKDNYENIVKKVKESNTYNAIQTEMNVIEKYKYYINRKDKIEELLFASECRKAGIDMEIDGTFANLRKEILTDNSTK